jgi:hypothetical protein
MNLLSNDVKLHANDWIFLKLSAVEREIDNSLSKLQLIGKEKLSDYEILTDDQQMIGNCIQRLMWK